MMVTSIPLHDVLHANQAAESWLDGRKTDPWSVGMQPETRARFFQQLTDTGRSTNSRSAGSAGTPSGRAVGATHQSTRARTRC